MLSFLNKLNDVIEELHSRMSPSTFAKHLKLFQALHVDSPAVHREVLGIRGLKLCCAICRRSQMKK